MTSRFEAGGWIAATCALLLLAVSTTASFLGGLHVEAGGVEMTLQASVEEGLQLIFAAAE